MRTSTRLEDRSPVKPEGAARGATCSEHREAQQEFESWVITLVFSTKA